MHRRQRVAPSHERILMKILLVDDTATIRTLMTTMLKRFDHQVTTAKDDVKAWRLLQETP